MDEVENCFTKEIYYILCTFQGSSKRILRMLTILYKYTCFLILVITINEEAMSLNTISFIYLNIIKKGGTRKMKLQHQLLFSFFFL